MNKEDLKQIKNIVEKAVDNKIEKFAQITARSFEDTQNQINGIKEKIDRTEDKVDELKAEVNELKEKVDKGVDRMLTVADSIASQFAHWKQENAMGAGIDARQEEQLKDHEVRIHKLEKLQR